MANLDALRAGGWDQVTLPDLVDQYNTMLTHGERRLLHWLARDVWEGWGAIVDAGSFLGGSTVSLATGLKARETPYGPDAPRPPMATYDLFLADDFAVTSGYLSRWPEIGVDESFRHVFDELVGDLADETTVHEGDITAERWDGGPIEILFLDVLKASFVNDAVLPAFMPSLVGGRSVLIQQDYIHGFLPWIHVTMELLGDCLEHVADVAGSRVYAVTRDIPAERLNEILPLDERVSPARQEALMEQAVVTASGDDRGLLLLAQANLLRVHDRIDAATALLEHVEEHYSDVPPIALEAQGMRRIIER